MSKLELPTAAIFQPLLVPNRYKAAWGGRGSGKSHFFAESILAQCISQPGLRVLTIREIQRSIAESAKRLIENKIIKFGVDNEFIIQRDRIITPGDGVILFQGMRDHTAESIKSLEGINIAWVEEAQTLSKRSLEFLRPTIRMPNSEIWFSWNPRYTTDPVDMMFRGGKETQNSTVVRALYRDNPWFPKELEQERCHDLVHNPQRYGHIWEGEYEPSVIGGLWTRAEIEQNRRSIAPNLDKIIVSVDPAISSNPGADETGIIVCGLGRDGRGYVLDDQSIRGRPELWARRVVAAWEHWKADLVIAEKNQGGEMVRTTLQTIQKNLPVKLVHASRRKAERAQPVAALDGIGRLSHIGEFPELEAQMFQMTMDGYQGIGSPDRVDARIHGFLHLFRDLTRDRKNIYSAYNKADVGNDYKVEF